MPHDALHRLLRRTGFDLIRWPAGTDQAHILKRLLDHHRVDMVIDVGGFTGDWVLWLRRLGYGGRVRSYEPSASSYGVLAAKAAQDPSWEAVHAAVGAESGSRELIVRTDPLMTSLFPNGNMPAFRQHPATTAAVETVPMVRLDENWPEGKVMLKSDAQGLDLDVLRGCGERIADVLVVHIELSAQPVYDGQPDDFETFAMLHDCGFKPAGFYPLWWDEAGKLVEYDGIFAR